MPRLAGDYSPEIVEVSKSVLAELITALKKYYEALVLVGGWAPHFILQKFGASEADFHHVGSIDIDLVVDPDLVDEEAYATMASILREMDYMPSEDRQRQFRWLRTVGGREIGVDFLCPKPPLGKGRRHRHQVIQRDLKARTLEGAEIALGHYFECPLSARLPGDGIAKVNTKVADLVACLALKGMALGERYNEKDAYDVYSVCAYYEGGPAGVAAVLEAHVDHPILRKGMESIAIKFRDSDAEGPSWAARFLASDNPAMATRIRQDAYMNVNEVFGLLDWELESG